MKNTLIPAILILGLAMPLLGQPPAKPAETKPADAKPAATNPVTPPKPEDKKPEEKKSETPKTEPAKPAPAEDKLVQVKMTTSMGTITIELNETKAPISVANFLAYADKGHYDGTIFHRVIKDFMIQGGGFTPDQKQKRTDAPIKNEWKNGLKNERGTISMARIGGNADSATCQFFINVVDNGGLDRPQPDGAAYAVFGKVISGMDVVDKIRATKTSEKMPGPGKLPDCPLETVTITKVERADAKKPEPKKEEAPKK
ncbi:MAG: peptidylprolyl isomerase [Phycisphaerales bacterium]